MYSIRNGKYHKFELSFQLFRVRQFIELTSCTHAAMFMGNVDFPAKYNIINSHSQVMKYLGLLHQIIVNHLLWYLCTSYIYRQVYVFWFYFYCLFPRLLVFTRLSAFKHHGPLQYCQIDVLKVSI